MEKIYGLQYGPSDAENTMAVFHQAFPKEITQGHTWEQVGELLAASVHYMNRVIPTCTPAGGVPNPSEAIAAFQIAFRTADQDRVVKEFYHHWKNLIEAIRMRGGLVAFCAEYREGLSPAEKAGWDRFKREAAELGPRSGPSAPAPSERRRKAAKAAKAAIVLVLAFIVVDQVGDLGIIRGAVLRATMPATNLSCAGFKKNPDGSWTATREMIFMFAGFGVHLDAGSQVTGTSSVYDNNRLIDTLDV